MPFYFFLWDEETVEHLDQHGVSQDDFESIVQYPSRLGKSDTSGREVAFGTALDGRYLICVFERIDQATIMPITACEIEN